MSEAKVGSELRSMFNFPGHRSTSDNPIRGDTNFNIASVDKDFAFNLKIVELKNGHIPFSVFKRSHALLAADALEGLLGALTFNAFKYRVWKLSEITNSDFYNYVLAVAALRRPDTVGNSIPPALDLMPDKFFSPVRETAIFGGITPETTDEIRLNLEDTGTDLDPEHRVAYFREDIGANSHHWHWHLVYPWFVPAGKSKDRKGELFYYMHRQMVARYDAERLSNGLGRVKALENWEEKIEEGYVSHLINGINGEAYASRVPGMVMSGATGTVSMELMEAYRHRIRQAIKDGCFIKPDGTKTGPITIDTLGAVIEGSVDGPNFQYYGNNVGIHNFGHDLLAQINDPDGRYKNNVPGGVMGYTETAIRDPIFFRWHKFIDDLFEEFKQTLEPYSQDELAWSAVDITAIRLLDDKSTPVKKLTTFIGRRVAEIAYPLDFQVQGQAEQKKLKLSMPYLDHNKFSYEIAVTNTTSRPVTGTVRVFLAPLFVRESFDITMDEYRTLCIELDKFTHEIAPGPQTISRDCSLSSVTITWDQIVSALNVPAGHQSPADQFCGCGWPDNLLIPGGTEDGMRFSLFVMITNWEDDKVPNCGTCTIKANAASYCGVLNEKYPDKRAMGFPFDRPIRATDLSGFMEGKSNMAALYKVPEPITDTEADVAQHSIVIKYTGKVTAPAPRIK